jgi:hypothetical protein
MADAYERVEGRSQEASKNESRRRLRSSSAQKAQQLQKDTVSHLPRSSEEDVCTLPLNSSTQLIHMQNRSNPPKTRKRPREIEVEQATDYIPAKRSRKLPQQLSPTQQPNDRKRPREALDPLPENPAEAPRKRARRSLRSAVVETSVGKGAASKVGEEEIGSIGYWTKTYRWRKEYAEQCRLAEIINSDRRHHRLASSRYTGTEQRLVGSLQPSLELGRV